MTDALLNILDHEFADPALLRRALLHRSAAPTGDLGYERLEFLGDRVLGLVVTDMLMAAFPAEDEGALARRLAGLVRRETLADAARGLGLGSFIRLSRSEEEYGGRDNETILADVCEAIIGALYQDGGLEAARGFIQRHWAERLAAAVEPPRDAKTALQEWAQGRGLPLPVYRMASRTGPDHAPEFTVSVEVQGQAPVEGTGPSKRLAEQVAAACLIQRIDTDD
ncbi:MAG: ribonuclease III [Alphaproteobacteria bacterium]|nr:ribonuclease III [Alphaproteobacteria bacterium]